MILKFTSGKGIRKPCSASRTTETVERPTWYLSSHLVKRSGKACMILSSQSPCTKKESINLVKTYAAACALCFLFFFLLFSFPFSFYCYVIQLFTNWYFLLFGKFYDEKNIFYGGAVNILYGVQSRGSKSVQIWKNLFTERVFFLNPYHWCRNGQLKLRGAVNKSE